MSPANDNTNNIMKENNNNNKNLIDEMIDIINLYPYFFKSFKEKFENTRKLYAENWQKENGIYEKTLYEVGNTYCSQDFITDSSIEESYIIAEEKIGDNLYLVKDSLDELLFDIAI